MHLNVITTYDYCTTIRYLIASIIDAFHQKLRMVVSYGVIQNKKKKIECSDVIVLQNIVYK